MDKLTKAVTNNGYIRIYALNARDTVQQAADFQGALPLGTAALGRLMCGGLMMGGEAVLDLARRAKEEVK